VLFRDEVDRADGLSEIAFPLKAPHVAAPHLLKKHHVRAGGDERSCTSSRWLPARPHVHVPTGDGNLTRNSPVGWVQAPSAWRAVIEKAMGKRSLQPSSGPIASAASFTSTSTSVLAKILSTWYGCFV